MQSWLRVGRLAITLLGAYILGCGGGGDSGIPPFWVDTDVAVADVDGDGRQDILTLATYITSYTDRQGHLYLYRQTSSPGTFEAHADYAFGVYPWHLVVGDIDGDGRPDLLVTDVDANTIWMLRQNASYPGTFLPPEALNVGASYYYYAVIADLNDDGAPDIAVPSTAQTLIILYQDPTNRGSFVTQEAVALPGRPDNLTSGDIDGDGLTDVLLNVVTNPPGTYPPTGGLVAVYQKPGGFDVSGILALQTGHNVDRLAIADATNDGRPDLLAFESPFGSEYATQLVVVPQSPTARSFDPPRTTSLGALQGLDDAVFAQVNTDAAVDAVVAGFWPESGGPYAYPNVKSRANVLLNNGFGDFVLWATLDMPIPVNRVTAGDLDGDGRNDIVLLGGENQCLVSFQAASGAYVAPRALQ